MGEGQGEWFEGLWLELVLETKLCRPEPVEVTDAVLLLRIVRGESNFAPIVNSNGVMNIIICNSI